MPVRQSPRSQLSPEGEIVLTLSAREDLFTAPDLDPFEGQFASAAGIERISRKLAALPRSAPVPRLRIRLPAEEITPQAAAETRRALAAFSEAELESLSERWAGLARERRWSLLAGLSFLLVCTALASLAEAYHIAHPLLERFVVDGLVIAGWVALWHPLDLLLYAGWPLRHEGRVLRALAAMEVVVEPQSSRFGPAAENAAAISAGS